MNHKSQQNESQINSQQNESQINSQQNESQINSQQNKSQINSQQNESQITAKWITNHNKTNHKLTHSKTNHKLTHSKTNHKLTHNKMNHKLTHSKTNHKLTHSKTNHKLTHCKTNHKSTHSKAQELVGQLDLLKSWHTDVYRPCTDHLVEVDGVVTAERQHRVNNTVLFRHLNDDKLPGQLGQGGWVSLWTVASHCERQQTVSKVMSLTARTQRHYTLNGSKLSARSCHWQQGHSGITPWMAANCQQGHVTDSKDTDSKDTAESQ